MRSFANKVLHVYQLILQCFKFPIHFFLYGHQLSFFLLGTSPHCISMEIKVTFPVHSAFSVRLSADFNSASKFDFILFFWSFKSFSSSRTAALFCHLFCSTYFLFSSPTYVWYLRLAELALARSSLLKDTLANPLTLMRWSLITLWAIKVCSPIFSTEISLP